MSSRAATALLDRMRRDHIEPSSEPVSRATLSPRELEILRLVARGMENAQIAAELNISPRTAKNHLSSILHKLGVANRVQAAIFAVRSGLG
jgi:DNA-binding NarL/FixJ family response regulator